MSIKLTPDGIKTLDDVVRNTAESNTLPAFAYGVTTADEEIYFNAAGPKVITDPSGPQIHKDDVFWLCSMTKMITHLAALHLIDQGKLSPETPVEEFFPQFAKTVIIDDVTAATPTSKPGTSKMLVKHLQHFTSGLFYGSRGDYGTNLDRAYSSPHNMEDPHTTWIEVLKVRTSMIQLLLEHRT
jgi:CubicO group peptidase (beta-lactamase class C family)